MDEIYFIEWHIVESIVVLLIKRWLSTRVQGMMQ